LVFICVFGTIAFNVETHDSVICSLPVVGDRSSCSRYSCFFDYFSSLPQSCRLHMRYMFFQFPTIFFLVSLCVFIFQVKTRVSYTFCFVFFFFHGLLGCRCGRGPFSRIRENPPSTLDPCSSKRRNHAIVADSYLHVFPDPLAFLPFFSGPPWLRLLPPSCRMHRQPIPFPNVFNRGGCPAPPVDYPSLFQFCQVVIARSVHLHRYRQPAFFLGPSKSLSRPDSLFFSPTPRSTFTAFFFSSLSGYSSDLNLEGYRDLPREALCCRIFLPGRADCPYRDQGPAPTLAIVLTFTSFEVFHFLLSLVFLFASHPHADGFFIL